METGHTLRVKTRHNNTYPKGGNFSFFWIVCNYFIVLNIITFSAGVPALRVAAERYVQPMQKNLPSLETFSESE